MEFNFEQKIGSFSIDNWHFACYLSLVFRLLRNMVIQPSSLGTSND